MGHFCEYAFVHITATPGFSYIKICDHNIKIHLVDIGSVETSWMELP
jgi:hypothetical protein